MSATNGREIKREKNGNKGRGDHENKTESF